MEERLRESEAKAKRFERSEEELRRQLAGSVSFSGELVAEQEKLLRELRAKSEEARIGGRLALRLDALKSQIQVSAAAGESGSIIRSGPSLGVG